MSPLACRPTPDARQQCCVDLWPGSPSPLMPWNTGMLTTVSVYPLLEAETLSGSGTVSRRPEAHVIKCLVFQDILLCLS